MPISSHARSQIPASALPRHLYARVDDIIFGYAVVGWAWLRQYMQRKFISNANSFGRLPASRRSKQPPNRRTTSSLLPLRAPKIRPLRQFTPPFSPHTYARQAQLGFLALSRPFTTDKHSINLPQSMRTPANASVHTSTLLLLFVLVLLPIFPLTQAFIPLLSMDHLHQQQRSPPACASPPPCASTPIFYSGGGFKLAAAAAEVGGHEEAVSTSARLTWGVPSITHTPNEATATSFPTSSPPTASTHTGHGALASTTTADVMSLDSIRSTLIRQEDSIIFALIERAQFRRNEAIYLKGILQLDPSIPDYTFLNSLSFLEYLLLETEKLHGKVRRYTSPEEHAFFPEHLPNPILTPLQFPALLAPNTVDVNAQILDLYINEIVSAVCKEGDDEQHGSSVLADITLLQAISRRIHLGKFVAEAKFLESEARYRALVAADDVDGVMALLTNTAVEARVLERAKLKASTYGQDITGETEECKVEPDVIAAIYRDIIIPLTKDVEVLYLFERVGRPVPFPLPAPAEEYRLRIRGSRI